MAVPYEGYPYLPGKGPVSNTPVNFDWSNIDINTDALREQYIQDPSLRTTIDRLSQAAVEIADSRISGNAYPGYNSPSRVGKYAGPSSSGSSSMGTITENPYQVYTTPALNEVGTNDRVYAPPKDYIPCYIIPVLTGANIEFDCEPDEISVDTSASFDQQDIRGRSNPYQGYNNSGPRTVNFAVHLHEDLCKAGLLNTVNALYSLTYPDYAGVLIPPECIVRIGDMLYMRAIVPNVSVTWEKPFRSGIYVHANISITLVEVVDTPHSVQEIYSNGGFR